MEVKNGSFKNHYSDGQIKEEGEYINGQKNGIWTYWYQNGQVWFKGSFENDIKIGTWIYYNEDGTEDYHEEHLDDGMSMSGVAH